MIINFMDFVHSLLLYKY